jgi:hypothetical protein
VSTPPILDNKDSTAASVFQPAALLREARRQKGLAAAEMPSICVLDPDGDVVRHLRDTDQAVRSAAWPAITRIYTSSFSQERWLASSVVLWARLSQCRRRTLCLRLPAAYQPDLGRPDRPGRQSAIFRRHRSCAPR